MANRAGQAAPTPQCQPNEARRRHVVPGTEGAVAEVLAVTSWEGGVLVGRWVEHSQAGTWVRCAEHVHAVSMTREDAAWLGWQLAPIR